MSRDNRRLLTMTWASEGLTLCFIGVLVLLVALLGEAGTPLSAIVVRSCVAMLIITAIWTVFTGARTPVLPIKLCPIIKTAAAILFLLRSVA